MLEALVILFILAGLLMIGYRFGWNAACRLYRDRIIDKANQQYEQDRK